MSFNKKNFAVNSCKKVLHKVKKQWVVVSAAALLLIGALGIAGTSVDADTIKSNHTLVTKQQEPQIHNTTPIEQKAHILSQHLIIRSMPAASAHRTRTSVSSRYNYMSSKFYRFKHHSTYLLGTYPTNSRQMSMNIYKHNYNYNYFNKLYSVNFNISRRSQYYNFVHAVLNSKSTLPTSRSFMRYTQGRSRNRKIYYARRSLRNYRNTFGNRLYIFKHHHSLAKFNRNTDIIYNLNSYGYKKFTSLRNKSLTYSKIRWALNARYPGSQYRFVKKLRSILIPKKRRRIIRRRSYKKHNSKVNATHKYLIGHPSSDNDVDGTVYISKSGDMSRVGNSISSIQGDNIDLVHIVGKSSYDGYPIYKISDPNYIDNKGWVFADSLSNNPHAKGVHMNLKKLENSVENAESDKAFTPNELSRINTLRNQYHNLMHNENNDPSYTQNPDISNGVPGQLSNSYLQSMMDWINFYRTDIYDLPALSDNSSYNEQAQYGADDLAALGDNLHHGFSGLTKPSTISESDWKRGSDATNSSNLSGGDKPYTIIDGYFNDENNEFSNNTGHRAWLLDAGLGQVGIGQDKGYNDLLVINNSQRNSNRAVTYPNAGVFPFEDANGAIWSLYMPSGYDLSNVSVSVHDDTDNSDLNVSNISTSPGYGYYSTLNYTVKGLKSHHRYTITFSGIPGIGNRYYNTVLFRLDNNDL